MEDAMLMFMAMLAGPSFAGIFMTAVVDGRNGLRELFARMIRWRVEIRWYLVVLIPPIFILLVLLTLSGLVSPVFVPSFTMIGLVIGLLAGFFEEIGWVGFALPKMQEKYNSLYTGLIIGVFWGLWHLLAGYLGSSATLGIFWVPHFVSMFILAMTATRVIIVWVYNHTKSVLLAQLIHASSTGFLYTLGPSPISPANEILWYIIYALTLWVFVIVIYSRYGNQLKR
ncbi:CPBP family intramembrane glutamic endopeptidase [Petrocella atlantisensis]|nr:CPBP family intramembrane glutamic endopeptidase [Petrocella atlantisensis]